MIEVERVDDRGLRKSVNGVHNVPSTGGHCYFLVHHLPRLGVYTGGTI